MTKYSVEVEFRVMAQHICEQPWLNITLTDLKMKIKGSIMMYCDKKVDINIVYNLVHHDHTKHVEVD